MNGKAQFYLNLGVTFLVGTFGLIGACFTEIFKPVYERDYTALAIITSAVIVALTVTISFLIAAYQNIEEEGVLRDKQVTQ